MPTLLYWGLALPTGVVLYRLAGRLIHQWAVARLTVLNELKTLGIDRPQEKKLKGTAVICGGRYVSLARRAYTALNRALQYCRTPCSASLRWTL